MNRGASPSRRESAIVRSLCAWFIANRRDLPWRPAPGKPADAHRDPYRVLVSEAMLQQTQVSRVLEKFDAFMRRFPTVRVLAEAEEADVLAAWSGLGYYRRARNLHAAAKMVAGRFAGQLPATVEELLELPGVGRYTAGAIASFAFGVRAPLVDGNVRRVFMRIEGEDLGPVAKETDAWSWRVAERLIAHAESPAIWNEALMELGALVCTPGKPQCERCPVRTTCRAHEMGTQEKIPRAKAAAKKREVFHACVVVRDGRGRVLVETRPGTGMWSGMTQPPTVERDDRPASAAELKAAVGLSGARLLKSFVHQTTHRTVRFAVYEGRTARGRPPLRGEFVALGAVAGRALSNPHRRMLLGTER